MTAALICASERMNLSAGGRRSGQGTTPDQLVGLQAASGGHAIDEALRGGRIRPIGCPSETHLGPSVSPDIRVTAEVACLVIALSAERPSGLVMGDLVPQDSLSIRVERILTDGDASALIVRGAAGDDGEAVDALTSSDLTPLLSAAASGKTCSL